MDMHCQCDRTKAVQPNLQPKYNSQSCKRCGKVIAGPKRLGSFTAFLLKDLRCGCAKPLLQVAGADAMATRYRPPQATWGKRQQQMQTALRTRANNTFARDAALVSLAPGTTIGGCYQLIEMVGKGGMGVVYKARHTALNRILALKFVAPSMVSRESWQLFQQEAKLNATLSHPSLCQIYDLGIHANALPYYAMDFIDGQTLEEVIMGTGPLSVGATLEIFIKVAEGLSYAHRRNVVHRDIKPANIMIADTTGDTTEIKLLDFGIAELGEKQRREGGQEAKKIIGSAAYMSPEQFAGRTTDARSDIYSLGCTIFETLTGALPFEGEDFDTLDRQHSTAEPPLLSDTTNIAYPQELEAVIKKCLHKSRDRRYQNASELAIDLQRILSNKELQFARAEQESLQEQQKQNNTAPPAARIAVITLLAVALIVPITLKLTESTHNFLKKQTLPRSLSPSPKPLSDSDNIAINSEKKTFDEVSKKIKGIREINENEFFVSSKMSNSTIPTRVFSFPDTGIAAVLVTKTPQGIVAKKCTGMVEITSKTLDLLMTTNYNSEQIVSGFRPQDITGLDLTACGTAESKLLAAALKRFELKSLRLTTTQWIAANLELLPYMASDSYLELVGASASSLMLTESDKLRPLSNIKTLVLTECNAPFEEILAMPNQMLVRELTINKGYLDIRDAKAISQWPRLKIVNINTDQSYADLLEPLLKCPRLEHLSIKCANLDLSSLDISKLTVSNKTLKLAFDKLRLSASNTESIKKLKRRFPTITITTPPY